MDVGDIWIADFGDERRRRALVLSNERFHRRSDQVLIAPEHTAPEDDEPPPWRISADGTVFALDRVRSVHRDRMLVSSSRVTQSQIAAVRRAIRAIT